MNLSTIIKTLFATLFLVGSVSTSLSAVAEEGEQGGVRVRELKPKKTKAPAGTTKAPVIASTKTPKSAKSASSSPSSMPSLAPSIHPVPAPEPADDVSDPSPFDADPDYGPVDPEFVPEEDNCVNRCDDFMEPNRSCQCDSGCETRYDCCSDFYTLCTAK